LEKKILKQQSKKKVDVEYVLACFEKSDGNPYETERNEIYFKKNFENYWKKHNLK